MLHATHICRKIFRKLAILDAQKPRLLYMLAAKMDLLIKRLDKHAHKKEATYGTVKAMDMHMTCEACGENGHSGNDCPETCEDALNDNHEFRP